MNLYHRSVPKLFVCFVLAVSTAQICSAQFGSGVTLNPSSINFGKLNVGASATQNGVAQNAGTTNVTVGSASMGGAGFRVTGLILPITLAPGKSIAFQVTFMPSSPGSVTGFVRLKRSDGTDLATLPLSGTGLVTPTQPVIKLVWDPSTSPVIGYYVYRGTQQGGPYLKLTSTPDALTAYTDITVAAGRTYYYVITAVSNALAESIRSNEATSMPY